MPIEKRQNETRDEFVSRCVSEEMNSGKPQDQALAICLTYADENFKSATPSVTDNTWSTEAPISIELESYDDYPKAASENACKVLAWRDEHGDEVQGMTRIGWTRANQLCKGEAISRETIARMSGFARHKQNSAIADDLKGTPWKDAGYVAWLGWGGDEGVAWAERKLEQIDTQNLAAIKISFDYDDTLSTERGTELAKQKIKEGAQVYIISARSQRSGMLSKAAELGIPAGRVFATGSNKSKVEKIKELGIEKHYDNNSQVITQIAGIGQKFAKQKRVIFNEDFDVDVVKQYKDLGYKVYVRSARKIKKRDHKVWNKLKTIGLSEDVMVFGEMKELDKRYNFDLHMTGQDPILEALKLRGEEIKFKKVLDEYPVKSIEEARQKETEVLSKIDLKFVTVRVVYQYAEIDGIPAAKSGSRDFCKTLMKQSNKTYTLDEIANLPNDHLVEMFSDYGLEPDVFQYRGGFYRLPGTLNTTPWCRHEWRAKVVMI